MPNTHSDRVGAALHSVAEHRLLIACRSLPRYLQGLWRQAPLYAHWKRLSALLRSFRIVRITARVITVLFAILQTGTLLILALAYLLVLLLLGGLFMLAILLIAAIRATRTNRILLQAARERTVCLLFMSNTPSAFFWSNARSLADRGFLVLTVSPFWLSARGLLQGRFYLTARKEADGIYLIRKYYLFSLRRRVLRNVRTVYFY